MREPRLDSILSILNELRCGRLGKRHYVDRWGKNEVRREQYFGTLCGLWFRGARCKRIKEGDREGPFCPRCVELKEDVRVAAILMNDSLFSRERLRK